MFGGYYSAGAVSLGRWSGVGGPVALVAPRAAAAIVGLLGLHWITLRNHRRVAIDKDGRIGRGLPAEFRGVHVQDVAPLSRELRALQRAESECAAEGATQVKKTFPTTDRAARELLAANPRLAELLESDCSKDCVRYRHWINGGRRGPKPQPGPGDGRFDALNERLELRGRRRVASWLEAVHVTVPPSRKWEDFGPRVEVLQEATGLDLNLPAPAEAIHERGRNAGACAEVSDLKRADLIRTARRGRLAADNKVPF